MDENKLLEIMGDKKFMREFISQKTVKDARALLKKEGFDFTEKDVLALGEIIENSARKDKPLTEEEVSNICGGVNFALPIIGVISASIRAILSKGSLEEKISMGLGGALIGGASSLIGGAIGSGAGKAIGGETGSKIGEFGVGGLTMGVGVALGSGLGLKVYHKVCAWTADKKAKK